MSDTARDTLQLRAYRRLSRELMMGRYKPGQAVSLRPLAARLGTSPMPVREAVSRLIAERALVLLPNRQVIVPPMTRARFLELSRARQLLEGDVTLRACTRIGPALLQKLVKINESLKEALAERHIRRALAYNLDFHLSIYGAAQSEIALPLIEMLWRQAGPFVALTPRIPGVRWTARFHDEIIEAVEAGEPRRARRAVQHDIEETLQQLLRSAIFEDA